MTTLARALLSALVIAAFALSAPAQAPYHNPVIARPGMHAEVADPYVLKWNGEYYLYTSGDPITAYHSEDLVHWDFIGPVLAASKVEGAWNGADVWAPEVVYRNGRFLMYYTATVRSKDWLTGELARRVGVAVSDRPHGPFRDIGRPVTPGWAIDGNVFLDPDSGSEYLFYSYLYEPRLPGAGLVADRMLAWDKVAGQPAHVTRGSEAWEDKDGDPTNGSLRYTNEASTVLKRHGKYYMMYSGGSWDLPTYALAYAVSDRLPEGGLDGPGWTKITPPLLRSTPLVDAPGHNSVTLAPNNVDLINVYHARAIPFLEPWNRMPFVDRLYWNHDRMWAPQPSLGALTPPDRPLAGDNFNRVDGAPGAGWKTIGGEWRVQDRQLLGTAIGGAAKAMPAAEPLTYFVLEANLRLIGQSSAGVELADATGPDFVQVLLDTSKRTLLVRGNAAGKPIAASVPLPEGFAPAAYHQLFLTRNGSELAVQLDGRNLHRLATGLSGPAVARLIVATGAAAFDGVALTPYFEDTFDEDGFDAAAHGWRGSNSVQNDKGALRLPAAATRQMLLKGDPSQNYEFEASVRWAGGEAAKGQVGIVAAKASQLAVVAGFDRNIWPHARFHVSVFDGQKLLSSQALPMPRGFQYDQFHTLRVVKWKSNFTFYLDGAEIAALSQPGLDSAQPGLFADHAGASFDNARYKRVVVAPNLLLNAGFETEQWESGKPVQGNPWQLAGSAREHYCCAHTGLRRLLIQTGEGSATYTLPALEPGRYRLEGWAIAPGGVRLAVAGATATVTGETWKRFAVEFAVPGSVNAGADTLAISASPATGSSVAVDDLYLSQVGP